MSYTRSLAQLRQSFLVRGQYENSADITPAVANELLNDALEESYNEIVKRWDDYYTVRGTPFSTTAGTDTYSIPDADFYKLRKVEVLISGLATDPQARWRRVYPISVDDTHRRLIVTAKDYKYWLHLGQVTIYPVPMVVETFRLFYVQAAPQLFLDTDTIEFDTPVEQKLVLNIALRDAYDRQDLPTDSIERKIDKLKAELRSAADHDAGEPVYLGRRTSSDDEYEELY